MIVVLLFALLLVVGVPIGFVVLGSAIGGVMAFTSTPL